MSSGVANACAAGDLKDRGHNSDPLTRIGGYEQARPDAWRTIDQAASEHNQLGCDSGCAPVAPVVGGFVFDLPGRSSRKAVVVRGDSFGAVGGSRECLQTNGGSAGCVMA